MFKRVLAATALGLAALSANAQVLLSENFDDVSTLAAKGWETKLLSLDPSGQANWYQGSVGPFASQSGAPESYIASNYSIVDSGPFANFLMTPFFSTAQAGTISFFARSAGDPGYTDLLGWAVMDNTGLGPLLSLSKLAGTVLNDEWTQYSFDFSAHGASSTARMVFGYVGSFNTSDYIGIDTVTVTAVPEPSTWALLVLGLSAVAFISRRRFPRA